MFVMVETTASLNPRKLRTWKALDSPAQHRTAPASNARHRPLHPVKVPLPVSRKWRLTLPVMIQERPPGVLRQRGLHRDSSG